MPTIQLTRDRLTTVDDADIDLNTFNWYCSSMGYACRDTTKHPRQCILMHRVILERMLNRRLNKNEEVDHINGNPLDNRRCNLRVATHSQNLKNQNLRKTNTSGYMGVSYSKSVFHLTRAKRWQAYIKINGRRKTIGWYATAEEAAHARDNLARVVFGEFARLNFPD